MAMKDKIGETQKANNGQMMTIIEWHSFSNITVQFEDGTIVYKKRYDHFKRGYIVNPNCPVKRVAPKDRVGQTNRASNGLIMTIEVYRNATDLDVRFETGELVQHRAYKEFCSGTIGCPGYGRFTDILDKYLGKKVQANNGQMMEVIGGNSHDDLTVRFEDGTEVQHIRSSSFNRGSVLNPNYTCGDKVKESFVGMTVRATNGLKMTIVKFRDANDIDVMFEDGVIVCHKLLQHFKSGNIKHPNINTRIKTDRKGEVALAFCGITMEITEYNTVEDITVKFETGYMNRHKYYGNFLTGRIGHPFPYQVGIISMDKDAYIYKGVGNFYCHCTKCGMEDIMTIEEMKNHKCIAK